VVTPPVSRRRSGRSTVGCLVILLILSAVAYFAVDVGEVYARYYRFQDAMRQEVRFARSRSDADIKRRLQAFGDSLGLPAEAGQVSIKRSEHSVSVWSEYDERVELPHFVRRFHFTPSAEGEL
jgi:hypothetical protein